jgi:hypothetical protein
MTRLARRLAAGVAVASAAAFPATLASCGGEDDGTAVDADDAFSEVERGARERPDPDRAAPRWEPVTALRGRGSASESFEIARRAVNWHARWRCQRGQLVLAVEPASEEGPLVRERCPGEGRAEALETGRLALDVTADGPWRVRIWQQVTTPLEERPLPGIGAAGAELIATGRFYGIERRGAGRVALHRLPDGRLALRFERFRTSANSDLFVWVSEAPRPRTTRQALRAPHRQIALLKSTVGDQNYVLPRGLDEDSIRSVVIWCEPVRIAYAAATLAR